MAIGTTFLGLLEAGPRHGYDLKRAYDERFGADRPLSYGQVYATLARLLKNGLVEVEGVEPGAGPDRKRYAITEAGVTDIERWLSQPEKPEPYLQSTLYAKVVLALLTGREANDLLDAQRSEHLRLMRELTARRRDDLTRVNREVRPSQRGRPAVGLLQPARGEDHAITALRSSSRAAVSSSQRTSASR